jgi:NADH-quinone oxidoreductase subunit J
VGVAFFLVIAFVAIVAATGVILFKNAVHAALSLVATLFCVALLFLNLGAEFLAAVQVLVYAGAIMVLFLFVITLLNPLRAETPDRLRNQAVFAGVLAVVLLFEMYFIIQGGVLAAVPATAPAIPDVGNVQALGTALYSTWIVPFEMTSVLLLVAIVGAVVLGRRQTP